MKRLALAAAAFIAVTAGATRPASTAEYRFLSSWDKRSPTVTIMAETFIKNVEAASKGAIKFTLSGPEAVPAFEQLQPVSAGAFHFLFTTGAYHFGTTPYMTAVEAIGGDMQTRRAAGLAEVVDQHYQRYGLKLIALPMSPNGGYNIVLRQPIGPTGDLQGRKIRAIPNTRTVISMLGGSAVTIPPAELYQSLEKGVVDGATWPVSGVFDYRFYEVTKYLLRPAFGFVALPIFMNLSAWNNLSEQEKKILIEEGRKVEDTGHAEMDRMVAEEEKALLAKGMTVTQMGDAQKAKLNQAWADGVWELTSQKSKKEIDELRAFAKSKGLTQ